MGASLAREHTRFSKTTRAGQIARMRFQRQHDRPSSKFPPNFAATSESMHPFSSPWPMSRGSLSHHFKAQLSPANSPCSQGSPPLCLRLLLPIRPYEPKHGSPPPKLANPTHPRPVSPAYPLNHFAFALSFCADMSTPTFFFMQQAAVDYQFFCPPFIFPGLCAFVRVFVNGIGARSPNGFEN